MIISHSQHFFFGALLYAPGLVLSILTTRSLNTHSKPNVNIHLIQIKKLSLRSVKSHA